MRSRMAGAGVEQMFYTLQAGLWWGDCGGNVLHLHLICANNDDKHAVNRATAILRLNEEEAAYLATCRIERGIGATALLLADGERTPLFIPKWPETIHRIVTGTGGDR